MSHQQRVLCHLIASGFAGGPEKQILESSPHMDRLGWRVVVGSFRENRPSVEVVDKAREAGLETFLIDTRSPFSPAAVPQLRGYLRQFRVDALITHGYKPNLIGRLAVRSLRVVHLPIVRGYTGEDWKVRLYEQGDRRLLRSAPRVLTVSEGAKRKLVGYGLDPARIEVVTNAVDCTIQPEAVDLAREFHLPHDAQTLVAAGRLSPEKGHRYLVEAMREIAGVLPRLYAIFLGSGREDPSLRNQIQDAGLDGRVILGGFRTPILGYLAAADLVVNPSLTEGLPNVVLEAMSVRTPVVATDVGGVSELIVPDRTGWLVPAGHVPAMAEAIREAIENPSTSRIRAEEGYRHVAGAYSFERQAERLSGVLETPMASAPRVSEAADAAYHEVTL